MVIRVTCGMCKSVSQTDTVQVQLSKDPYSLSIILGMQQAFDTVYPECNICFSTLAGFIDCQYKGKKDRY